MVSHFRPLLLPARARGTHFLLPLGSVILQLGVPQATVKAGWPAAFPRLATEKGSRWAVDSVSTVSAAADLDFFAVSVCPFAAATERGRAAVAISCFLAPRFSF